MKFEKVLDVVAGILILLFIGGLLCFEELVDDRGVFAKESNFIPYTFGHNLATNAKK